MRSFVFLAVCLFSTSLLSQEPPAPDKVCPECAAAKIQPVADSSIQVDGQSRARKIAIRGVKILLKAKLRAEKRKLFGRDSEKIARLEVLVEADELIETVFDKKISEFEASIATNPSAKEFGDGTLLEMWLDFFQNPDELAAFIEKMVELVGRIIELIGPLL